MMRRLSSTTIQRRPEGGGENNIKKNVETFHVKGVPKEGDGDIKGRRSTVVTG